MGLKGVIDMEEKKLTDEMVFPNNLTEKLNRIIDNNIEFIVKQSRASKWQKEVILETIQRLQEERACFANKVSLYQKLLDEEFEPLKETIKKQKAEIERLTKWYDTQSGLYNDLQDENKELQEQVDKLKERNYWLESEHEYQCEKSYFEGVEKGKEQAVKDTAKELFCKINSCIKQGQEYCGLDWRGLLTAKNMILVWCKKKGVEVE